MPWYHERYGITERGNFMGRTPSEMAILMRKFLYVECIECILQRIKITGEK